MVREDVVVNGGMRPMVTIGYLVISWWYNKSTPCDTH